MFVITDAAHKIASSKIVKSSPTPQLEPCEDSYKSQWKIEDVTTDTKYEGWVYVFSNSAWRSIPFKQVSKNKKKNQLMVSYIAKNWTFDIKTTIRGDKDLIVTYGLANSNSDRIEFVEKMNAEYYSEYISAAGLDVITGTLDKVLESDNEIAFVFIMETTEGVSIKIISSDNKKIHADVTGFYRAKGCSFSRTILGR